MASLIALVVADGAAFSTASTATHGAIAGDLSPLLANPAIRALYGVPWDISNRGGFTVWRGSTIILLLAGLWGALTSTRVLRGEEEAGRWDLILAAPLRRTTSTAVQVAVLALVCLAVAVAVAVSFVAAGSPASGSVLFGAGVGLVTLIFTAVGTCVAQVFSQRRLAAGVSVALVGGAMVVRMAANASSGAAWVRWLTPFGWVDNLRPFAGNHLIPLLPLVAAPCVFLIVAAILVHRRDLGTGMIRSSETARARTLLLGGPLTYACRQRLGGLAGWSAGLAFYGLVMGAITGTSVRFIAETPSVQHLTSQLGMTGLSTPAGFIADLAPFVAVALAYYAASSLGRCHEDEETGRLDLPYAQPVTRSVWLGSQVGAAVAGAVVAAAVSIIATWLGGIAGDAGLNLHDVTVATFNVMPAVAIFFGVAILLFGVHPSLAVAVAGGGAVAAYIVTFIGPALNWPRWVLDLSPFDQLKSAPVSPVAWTAIAIILVIALLAAVVGFLAYERRDLA